MSIGSTVRKYRESRGLSQGELARLSGYTAAFICNLEKDKYEFTSREALTRIAKALKVKTRVLYDAALLDKTPESPSIKSIKEFTLRELQTNIIEIPILAELHMPGEIMEYTYMARPKPGKLNYVGIHAKGYCLEPDILDGDVLIVDKDAVPEPGRTILCYHNGSQHPRLLKYTKPEDIKDCDIYGIVIGINRKL